jgi:hypothetical protein
MSAQIWQEHDVASWLRDFAFNDFLVNFAVELNYVRILTVKE